MTSDHSLNSCWMNAAFGAFANLVGYRIAAYLSEYAINSKNEDLLALLSDLFNLRNGPNGQNKLSDGTIKMLGYDGIQHKVGDAISVINNMLNGSGIEIDTFFVDPSYRNSLIKKLDSFERSVRGKNSVRDMRMTFFVGDEYGPIFKSFDHIYCLHVFHNGKDWIYCLANDKGFGLNYNARSRILTRSEAEKFLSNKGVGYAELKICDKAKSGIEDMEDGFNGLDPNEDDF